LTDERIGAARRRTDIADFLRGALVSPFITAGNDGRLGTPDDVFAPTNETALQIQNRVLPIGATINGVRIVDDSTRVPVYLKTPAFASVNLRAGIVMTENISLNLALMNLLDRNYRIHGSGVDASGISFFAGLKISF
jgi:outer membrane receptor protein involved in Fe transport